MTINLAIVTLFSSTITTLTSQPRKVSISAHFLIFESDKMADHKQFANILAGVASAAKQITHIIAVDVFLVHYSLEFNYRQQKKSCKKHDPYSREKIDPKISARQNKRPFFPEEHTHLGAYLGV